MKFTIPAVNQLGLFHLGLVDKVDLVDLALLDYVAVWSMNRKALKFNDMVWINYAHVITEMPMLHLKSKSSISTRIRKLRDLKLIATHQDEIDKRLYAKVTELYADIIGFTQEDIIPVTVRENEQPPVGKKVEKPLKLDAPIASGGVRENEQGVRTDEQGVRTDEQGVRENVHTTETLLTEILITDLNNTDTDKNATTKKVNTMITDIDVSSGLDAGISFDCLLSFVQHRKKKKAPLTQRAFDQSIITALKCPVELNISAEEAIDETVNAGWSGINIEYLKNRLSKSNYAAGNKVSPIRTGFPPSKQTSIKTTGSTSQQADAFFDNVDQQQLEM